MISQSTLKAAEEQRIVPPARSVFSFLATQIATNTTLLEADPNIIDDSAFSETDGNLTTTTDPQLFFDILSSASTNNYRVLTTSADNTISATIMPPTGYRCSNPACQHITINTDSLPPDFFWCSACGTLLTHPFKIDEPAVFSVHHPETNITIYGNLLDYSPVSRCLWLTHPRETPECCANTDLCYDIVENLGLLAQHCNITTISSKNNGKILRTPNPSGFVPSLATSWKKPDEKNGCITELINPADEDEIESRYDTVSLFGFDEDQNPSASRSIKTDQNHITN